MSRTTISGRLNTYGLSVEMGVSHSISTFFKVTTSGGLWVCHLEHVWIWKLLHMAWCMYCATPLWRSRYSFFARISHPDRMWDIVSGLVWHTLHLSSTCFFRICLSCHLVNKASSWTAIRYDSDWGPYGLSQAMIYLASVRQLDPPIV